MKKLLLILLCLPMIGFGQGWERTFDFANEYDDGTVEKRIIIKLPIAEQLLLHS